MFKAMANYNCNSNNSNDKLTFSDFKNMIKNKMEEKNNNKRKFSV